MPYICPYSSPATKRTLGVVNPPRKIFDTPGARLPTILLNCVKLALIFQVNDFVLRGVPVMLSSEPFVCRSPTFNINEPIPVVFETGTPKISLVDFCLYLVASIVSRPLKNDNSIPTSWVLVNSGPRLALPAVLLRVKPCIPLKGKVIVGPNPSAEPAPTKYESVR